MDRSAKSRSLPDGACWHKIAKPTKHDQGLCAKERKVDFNRHRRHPGL